MKSKLNGLVFVHVLEYSGALKLDKATCEDGNCSSCNASLIDTGGFRSLLFSAPKTWPKIALGKLHRVSRHLWPQSASSTGARDAGRAGGRPLAVCPAWARTIPHSHTICGLEEAWGLIE